MLYRFLVIASAAKRSIVSIGDWISSSLPLLATTIYTAAFAGALALRRG
jgi:hypothetical protein